MSLDIVEEMSLGLPDRVTKSHLSRIENGQAIPSFPRMFTLSQIYGVPVSSMAERFELCLKAEMYPAGASKKTIDEVLAEASALRRRGRYAEAFVLCESLLERANEIPAAERAGRMIDLRLHCITCLTKLSRDATAKEEGEKLLGEPGLSDDQEVRVLYGFAQNCYRLGKFSVAVMAIERAEQIVARLDPVGPHHAHLAMLKGDVLAHTSRFEEAAESYRFARKTYDSLSDGFYACRARLNLAACLVETGAAREARRILRDVIAVADAEGYDRQRAYAFSHLALLAYRENDIEGAEAYCLRSNRLARSRDYTSILFRNCFYLWRISRSRDDDTGVRTNERTLRTYLNRVEGFMPEAEEFRAFLGGGKNE